MTPTQTEPRTTRRLGAWTLSVERYDGDWIAFARYEPNPLASVWYIADSEDDAWLTIDKWEQEMGS